MTTLNQFESVFNAADKSVYAYSRPIFQRVLLVCDLDATDGEALAAAMRAFLRVIDGPDTRWDRLDGGDFDSIQALLEAIELRRPDLIVTYRHLHSNAWNWPHGLGEYLDVMTQATSVPVLVLPHPNANRALPHSVQDTDRVMAITSHLTGDDRLVNHALAFTQPGGTCWLTHVEGAATFERYMDAIGKIPALDTEVAREAIGERLLSEPRDYIASCRAVIAGQNLPVTVEEVVVMGRRIEQYRMLIEAREIDLLVLYTKDEDQLAMNGHAYPLAVELRGIPLLML